MDAAQIIAFDTANVGSSAITSAETTFLIRGILIVLLLLWYAWVCNSSYSAFGVGKVQEAKLASLVLRGLFVVTILIVIALY